MFGNEFKSSRAADLQAGLAVVDITPPVPYRMCGYFNERLSTGVHDPLCAKALVLRQGDRQLAMVYCDLVGVSADISIRAREAAEKKTGIAKDSILIACTHTHTGPLFRCALRDYFHEQSIAKHGSDPYEKVDYVAMICDGIAQAISRAQGALRPVSLSAGVANEPGLSFNRRFHLKDGSVVFNPGKLNPNIVRVAGPIDPEVGIVLVRDAADSRPLGSLTVFALHLDTLSGTLYSADFPYWLEQSLRENLGGSFVSLFGNGTCGDINHINFMSAHAQPGGGPETKRIGQSLAARVNGEIPKLKAVARPRLGVRTETVLAPLQKYSPEEIAWAKASMAKIGTDKLSFLDQVKAYKIMDLQCKSDPLPIFVQAFRLSDDVALVALPGEVFVELGLAIKKASPFAQTMVVELAHDCPDYVPTRKAFAEGSYETVNSRIQPGGGEMAVEAAIRLLKQLKE
jgi:hypothetical protein